MQFARYLAVGIWNTAFGYATFGLLTYWLTDVVPYSYMVATVLSSLVNITVAFLGYKRFVFRTKGNYLREWSRCVMVYSGAIGLSLVLMPIFVYAIKSYTAFGGRAPYIAGAITAGISAVVSFLGHKRVSFRQTPREETRSCS